VFYAFIGTDNWGVWFGTEIRCKMILVRKSGVKCFEISWFFIFLVRKSGVKMNQKVFFIKLCIYTFYFFHVIDIYVVDIYTRLWPFCVFFKNMYIYFFMSSTFMCFYCVETTSSSWSITWNKTICTRLHCKSHTKEYSYRWSAHVFENVSDLYWCESTWRCDADAFGHECM